MSGRLGRGIELRVRFPAAMWLLQSRLARDSLSEILLCPLVDAIQRLLQVLQRIRHAEAQVAFAELSECRARERCYSGLLEQSIGKRLRFPSRLRDVGKGIKRAFRHAAGKALDLIQPGDEHIAAPLELGTH